MLPTASLVSLGFFASAVLAAPTDLASLLKARGESTEGTITVQALVKSPASRPDLNISVLVEFEGYVDGRPTFIKVTGESGLFNDGSTSNATVFAYHVHEHFVPADGNCTGTFAHLDPLNVTEGLVCNPAFPQYCQEGDLSGKHGALNGTSNGAIDPFGYSGSFVRFLPLDHSIFGRSVTLHGNNKERLACGNITSILDGTLNAQGEPTYLDSTINSPSLLPKVPTPQPAITVVYSTGTVFPSNDTICALPLPFPSAALPLSKALNVELSKGLNLCGKTVPVDIKNSTYPFPANFS